MINAIVLINVVRGRVPQVAQTLADMPEVSEVFSVTGDYDLVAVVRVKEYEQMAEVVPARIDRVDGIEQTTTLMAFKVYSRHDLEHIFSLGAEDEMQYRRSRQGQ
ncbi:MAG TPA: Lrp/AsnC ligand binding domain-containing protein [Chloroflexota bacterium]|jgi:DNA-binding Lrp family transcriptional regulator